MFIYFIYALLLFECTAMCTAWLCFKQQPKEMKYFAFYLTFIFFSEVLGHISQQNIWNHLNMYYLNLFVIPIEFLFFFWLYYSLTVEKVHRLLILFFSSIYLLLFMLECFHIQTTVFLSLSYLFGSISILIMIFGYFLQYLKNGDLQKMKSNPFLHISIGLLLFYLGTSPYYGLKNFIYKEYTEIINNYWYVAICLNCIMYCMFTVSFLCNRRKSI